MTTSTNNSPVPVLGKPAFPRLDPMARRGSVQTAGPPALRKPKLAVPSAEIPSAADPLQDPTEKELHHQAADSDVLPASTAVTALRIAQRQGHFLALGARQLPSAAAMASPDPESGALSLPVPPIRLPAQMARAAEKAAGANSSGVSFYEQVSRSGQSKQGMKEMASMRALSRLLESVYQRPGGDAPVQERIAALQELVGEADAVAREMAKAFGYAEGSASQYVMAQAMEAVVGLVSRAWERDETVNWAEMIAEAGVDPLIVGTAETMAHAVYKPVTDSIAGREIAQERLAISLHNAFWEVYLLGNRCDGITPEVASQVVRSISEHVQAQTKFNDLDLRVGWMQGSIKRMTGLFCAQMRSLDTAPTAQDIDRAVQLAKDGFDGVELHASQLLEMCRIGSAGPQHVDTPSRPGGG